MPQPEQTSRKQQIRQTTKIVREVKDHLLDRIDFEIERLQQLRKYTIDSMDTVIMELDKTYTQMKENE